MGRAIKRGEDICAEYIITSILLGNNSRLMESISIILAKNKINYDLLIFLSQKYGVSEKLLGLLKAFIKLKRVREANDAIKILTNINVRGIAVDEEMIKEKMELYHAY